MRFATGTLDVGGRARSDSKVRRYEVSQGPFEEYNNSDYPSGGLRFDETTQRRKQCGSYVMRNEERICCDPESVPIPVPLQFFRGIPMSDR